LNLERLKRKGKLLFKLNVSATRLWSVSVCFYYHIIGAMRLIKNRVSGDSMVEFESRHWNLAA